MEELRVPTVALAAEILVDDGRKFAGRLFVPAASARHAGPARASEWLNEAVDFFPFLPDDARDSVILSKRQVVAVSVAADANADPAALSLTTDTSVVVECGSRRLEGRLLIDMPQGQGRVLDYMNRAERFLTLVDGNRHHLIRKSAISRVVETRD
ncbi:MAG TPA: hypothetical protein VJT73_15395 [Polyangiaceae bacterium]|nr:hypothetical protein [Polyangiaceae bacterium]